MIEAAEAVIPWAPMSAVRVPVLALVLLASACSKDSPPEPQPTPTSTNDAVPASASEPELTPVVTNPPATVTPSNTPPSPTPTPALNEQRRPTPEQAKTLRRLLRAHLDEGRKAAKKGDYPGAIVSLGLAREIEPSDPTVLGELGWAAFKAGNLSLAQVSTIQATVHSQEPKQLGALYYNLGRIHEDKTDLLAAVAAYQTSLAYRDNEVVAARLADVKARSPVEHPQIEAPGTDAPASGEADEREADESEADESEDDSESRPKSQSARDAASGGLDRIATLADLPLACAALVEQRCGDYSFGDEPCTCDPTLVAAPEADASWGLLAMHVGSNDAQVVWYPVVQTDAGWVLFREVAWAFNPGVLGVWESVLFEPTRTEPLLAKDHAPLVFTFTKSRADSDMGLNELEQELYTATVVCTRAKADAWCTIPLLLAYEFERDVEFPEDTDETLEHSGLPIARSYAVELSFASGKLVLAGVVVKQLELGRLSVAAGALLPQGSYALEALLGS